MRRPNRSIEVFDISLMAVVTKAMGAFLVLMLLLMPYYSSGPIGAETAAELARRLDEAEKKLKSLSEQAGQFSDDPERLRKLLEEARKELEAAQQSLARLERDNDALNAQVKRLEERAKDLEAERDKLQRELMLPVAIGHLTNWDCSDVRLELGVVQKGTVISIGDPAKESYLNYDWGVGDRRTMTADEALKLPNASVDAAPGKGLNFNQSGVITRLTPGTWAIAIVSKAKDARKVHDRDFRPLKKPAVDCSVLIDLSVATRTEEGGIAPTQQFMFPKTNALLIWWLITVSDTGTFSFEKLTPEATSWLTDQEKLAEYVASDPPPPDPGEKLRKEIRERMKQMERDGELPPRPDRSTPPPSEDTMTPEEREKLRQQQLEQRQKMEELRRLREQNEQKKKESQ